MRVLVTGGAGFLGSTLVPHLLSRGHQVRVVDRLLHGGAPLLGFWADPGFEFVLGDVRDPEVVRTALDGVDAVVHLAAIVGDPACARQPDLAKETNIEASLRLIEEARKRGSLRFVFASTCSNYGKMADRDRFADEEAELRPVSLYAETKVAVERALLDEGKTRPLCATALRFATIFGVSPRMRFDLTVNEFTMKLITERELLVYGEQFWRPYVHVRDAARAIELVLGADPDRVRTTVFNVGSTDQNFRKQDLVEMILPHAPGASVKYVHKDEDPRDYRVSFERIRSQLEFTVTRSVSDGIREIAKLVKDGVIGDYSARSFSN